MIGISSRGIVSTCLERCLITAFIASLQVPLIDYGLRDYGTAQWEGGSVECDHLQTSMAQPRLALSPHSTRGGAKKVAEVGDISFRNVCGKCGARRIDGQIGLEQSPAEFVRKMVEVFEEVRRVLRSDGTLWLNLGDSYAGSGQGWGKNPDTMQMQARAWRDKTDRPANYIGKQTPQGLKPKDLMLMPARVALALQESGWWVRSDIIWCKRAPMPESVTDRPTSAHEHVFLLSKAERYFYDADAVREQSIGLWNSAKGFSGNGKRGAATGYDGAIGNQFNGTGTHEDAEKSGRNLWNYWLLSPEPYAEAHFATFPTEIPRRAILAGTSEHGCCSECLAPWKRVVELGGVESTGGGYVRHVGNPNKLTAGKVNTTMVQRGHITTGWQPTCRHASAPVVPATVLDPFSGAGTTVMQALRLGRRGIGIELNPQYVEMSKRRIMADAPLFNTPMEVA